MDADANNILSTGYSEELPGDRSGDPGTTHAEHCCFVKVAEAHGVPDALLNSALPPNTLLYTTRDGAVQ